MEYTTPLSLLKSATEAFRYKEYYCVYWDRSFAKVLTPTSVQQQLGMGETIIFLKQFQQFQFQKYNSYK
jgi:hypothetical protein